MLLKGKKLKNQLLKLLNKNMFFKSSFLNSKFFKKAKYVSLYTFLNHLRFKQHVAKGKNNLNLVHFLIQIL